jgi:protein phosphatase
MCSDGLSDMLPDENLAQLLQGYESLEEAGHALIAAANEAGGKDNIAVILVRAPGSPAATSKSWWAPFRR